MIVVGLTGSSGSGKGYISEKFAEKGIKSLDTDAVCHRLYESGEECNGEILEKIGDVADSDGNIDRVKLAAVIFNDKEKYSLLNEIAHRHIKKKTLEWIEACRKDGEAVAVIDAPLLFESGFDALCDIKISVISDRETQISRIKKRDGITEEKAIARLNMQKKPSWYGEKSDFILDNSDSNRDFIKAQAYELADRLITIGKNNLHI